MRLLWIFLLLPNLVFAGTTQTVYEKLPDGTVKKTTVEVSLATEINDEILDLNTQSSRVQQQIDNLINIKKDIDLQIQAKTNALLQSSPVVNP